MAQEATTARSVSAFHRFLHRSYSQGSSLAHFVHARVSPIAWGALCVMVAGAVMGTDVGQSTIYQIFTLMVGVFAVALVWAWARRAKLTAKRVVPQYATAGEECGYHVEITNRGSLALASFRLLDRVPDPRPPIVTFSHTPEPGEEERNAFDRLFIYYRWKWLVSRRLLFSGGSSPLLAKLKVGASKRVRIRIVPKRRGIIRLEDLRVQLPDPLGLFQRCRVIEAPGQSLVVLPKRYRLPAFDFPGRACFQLGGEAGSNTVGNSGEFLGLREYRSGDALRHVHWKAWAKMGKPIVKEFEENFFPRYGLILDNFADAGEELLFEEAVSVAASFASSVDSQSTLLDLMFVQGVAVKVSTGRGVARAEKMLEVLAGVEVEPEEHFDELCELVGQHAEVLTACVCVFTGWSAGRARFSRRLAAMGLESVNFVVCQSGGAVESQLREFPANGRVILLQEGKIQQSLLSG